MANQLLLEEVIVNRLRSNSAVTADLDSSTSCRVYPFAVPQNAEYPCAVYSRDISNYEHKMSGDGNICFGVISIMVVAESFLKARNVSGNIRLAISGLRGSYTVGAKSLTIQRLLVDSDEDDYVEPAEGRKDGLWINKVKYNFTYLLETPTLD